MRAVSSAVERLPYKQDVTGSIPVPPIQKCFSLLSFANKRKDVAIVRKLVKSRLSPTLDRVCAWDNPGKIPRNSGVSPLDYM